VVLAAAARAYRAAPAMTDTLTYTVKAPNADSRTEEARDSPGLGNDARFRNPLPVGICCRAHSLRHEERLSGEVRGNSYADDFSRALNSIVGRAGLAL